MKYLVAGLGNIGKEYDNTRHNVGFMILDALAGASNIIFEDRRYGFVAEYKFKARTFILLKPSTYVNLSGRAVSYWLKKEGISPENLLVICDDIALPFGTLRLRAKGSDGGHNGLRSISDVIGTNEYARLRFGVGDHFHKGFQVDYVLGKWSPDEARQLQPLAERCTDVIRSFGSIGIERTMNLFNKKEDNSKSEPPGNRNSNGQENQPE